MSNRVILMANDLPGVEVARYLIEQGDQIVRLYVHGEGQQKHVDEIIRACGRTQMFEASALKDREHVAGLPDLSADNIITVYWAHLLSPEVIQAAKETTVNFHPAMLPVNRGWYPHVHSLLDGSATGVTLHVIDENADTGPIWAQREVPVIPTDTASTLYRRLQSEIVQLFTEVWPQIKSGSLKPKDQTVEGAVYHRKSEVAALDRIDPEATMKVKDVINFLRDRSFDDMGFAYVDDGNQRVHLNLRLSTTHEFPLSKAS